jgi:hypothetical protein
MLPSRLFVKSGATPLLRSDGSHPSLHALKLESASHRSRIKVARGLTGRYRLLP